MTCLDKDEVRQWLSTAGQIEDPHSGPVAPTFALQVYAPQTYAAIECFLRCFIQDLATGSHLLLVAIDCEPSEESQRFVHETIRRSTGEQRSVGDAPGYRADDNESEKLVALFSLMSCFGWKCYLYADRDQVVLYNWEGEIFDFWTSSKAKHGAFMEMVKTFGLKEIEA
jgi:hypothetical protein